MNRTVKTGVYTRNDKENKFTFYTYLRSVDKIKFINFVTGILIGDNYYSLIRNIVFDIAIVHIFTDVDVSDILSSNDAISKIEDFLVETNIVEIVKANVDSSVIEELSKAIDDNIEYRTGIHKNPITESLSHLLDTIEKKVSSIDIEKMMEMAQVISGMSDELTADKMLEAYSNSDLFKKNYEQIIADRKKHDDKIEVDVAAIKKSRNSKKIASAK